jgi:hypothetical protein
MANKFVPQLLAKLNKGETYKFAPVKLGTPGRALSLDMISKITYMVNTGKPVDMPEKDTSPSCTDFDNEPNLPVIGIFFRQRENDKYADEEDEEQKKQRGEVLALIATKAGIAAAAAYSKKHADGDDGGDFGEWAQGMGFPGDLWGQIATMIGLAFREVENDYSPNSSKKPENKILSKFNVADFELSCPNPDDYNFDEEDKALGNAHLDAIFFYKSEA